MHLLRLSTFFTYLIVLASASPMAWPDDKLEEINALRAKGVSEVSRSFASVHSIPLLFPSFFCKTVFINPSGLDPPFKLTNHPLLTLIHPLQAEIAARNPQPLTSAPLSKSISFFGRSIMGTADIPSSAPLGGTARVARKERSFRASVGRRGEEIARRL